MYQKITIFLLVALNCFSSFSQSVEKKDTTDTRHTLKEVEITAWQQRKILSGLLSGKIKLNVAELNTLPRFLGETDALRTMRIISQPDTSERSSHIQCYAHAGFFLGIQ